MIEFVQLVNAQTPFLLNRVIGYAKRLGYTKYTSTLEDAWIVSIRGLSDALTAAIKNSPEIPEILVDHDLKNDPVAAFGIMEAQKHRSRGITLEMFLSLMKYYRQSYLDMTEEFVQEQKKRRKYQIWILRFFDFTEIAFCSEWSTLSCGDKLQELQRTNRSLTNEKNKYLTIYESMPTPALIIDLNHCCINMNVAAQRLLVGNINAPGHMYYSEAGGCAEIGDVLPWLRDDYMQFVNCNLTEHTFETVFDGPGKGERILQVRFHKMLDVSQKYEGTVILIDDLTEIKRVEEKLRGLSFHDQLTGLYNRTYMDEEIRRLSSGRHNPVAFISIDVDGLKLVNDTFGHGAGDALLVTVGNRIKLNFRENDVVVRVGGDEFIVLIPNCDMNNALRHSENVRLCVENYNAGHDSYPISLSIGCSAGDINSKRNAIDLIKEADMKMYEEKKINHEAYEILFCSYVDQK